MGWWGETGGGGMVAKKRVMVVIDQSSRAKHAMMWALTHAANKGDRLALLHVVVPHSGGGEDDVPNLATLQALCKACKPEVLLLSSFPAFTLSSSSISVGIVTLSILCDAVVKVKINSLTYIIYLKSDEKVEVEALLIQGPKCRSEEFVEQCINKAECLTLAVRKQSKGVGGYLISTRWQKDFWLLA
ncbi:hypothetical protein GW17_00002480 [Ensete ventricosum]|nr:hypothetical protein GW17_00002480 [Ensete ventricosum]